MDTLVIWILVYFVLASQFYILDKKGKFFLRKIYLFFYNLGHRQEITESEVDKGFVYNQSIATRLTAAVIFDVILSALFWNINAMDNGIKILLMFIGTPASFLGFWFGGVLMEIINKTFKRTIKTIDDIETGKIDPVEEVQKTFDGARHNIEGSFNKKNNRHETEPNTDSSLEQEIVDDKQREDEEALAALRAFQKGSNNVR